MSALFAHATLKEKIKTTLTELEPMPNVKEDQEKKCMNSQSEK